MSLLDLTAFQGLGHRLPARVDALVASLKALDSNRVRAIKEAAAALSLAGFMVALGVVGAGASATSGFSPDWRARQIAWTARGDFSNVGLKRLAADMDPATLKIVQRYDPLFQKPQQPGLWVDATGGAYDAPPEFRLRDLSPQEAMMTNASMPFSILPNPPALPFTLKVSDPAQEAHAVTCLTAAIYYEAANQTDDGQAAVAQVVLNRVRHPLFPKTVCGVVFQGAQLSTGCQFSFTCDGSLARLPTSDGWIRAQRNATRALHGYVFAPVGEATHYHTMWVVPYWSTTLVKLTQVGAHIFYRWSGSGGLPGAFRFAYAGGEGDAWSMASAKLIRVSGPVVMVPSTPQIEEAPSVQMVEPATVIASPATGLIKPAETLTTKVDMQPTFFQPLNQGRAQSRLPAPSAW